MKITKTELPGLILIEPEVFHDARGLFFESFHNDRFKENGIAYSFVQDNFSRSKKGVLRGMHYQIGRPQGKLIWVTQGKILDVTVDIRQGSPTFGKKVIMELSSEFPKQIYIPPGCAHGFCVLEEDTDFHYKCTDYYDPASERGISWNDPELNIEWPISKPILSEKDTKYPFLKDIPVNDLPKFS